LLLPHGPNGQEVVIRNMAVLLVGIDRSTLGPQDHKDLDTVAENIAEDVDVEMHIVAEDVEISTKEEILVAEIILHE
jgi:hypothetical protein